MDISTGILECWISSKSGLIGCCYLFSWKNHDWVRSGVKTTDWPKVKSFKCLIFLPKSWLFIIGIISEKNLNWSIVVIFHILSRYRRISRFTIGISSLFMKWWNLPIWIFCGQKKHFFSKWSQNEMTTSMLVTDVGDEMFWWQFKDVGDSLSHFGHQNLLSYSIKSPTSQCHQYYCSRLAFAIDCSSDTCIAHTNLFTVWSSMGYKMRMRYFHFVKFNIKFSDRSKLDFHLIW